MEILAIWCTYRVHEFWNLPCVQHHNNGDSLPATILSAGAYLHPYIPRPGKLQKTFNEALFGPDF